MSLVTTLHVFGAILLLGGVTAQLLLRPMTLRPADATRAVLYQLAWRIQVTMVYLGAIIVAVTGIVLWVGRFKLLTGWLLLGVLLFVAAMGLDGAVLAPSIRRARGAASELSASRGELRPSATAAEPGGSGAHQDEHEANTLEPSTGAGAAAVTVQVVSWFLLVVVVFLMVARPF